MMKEQCLCLLQFRKKNEAVILPCIGYELGDPTLYILLENIYKESGDDLHVGR